MKFDEVPQIILDLCDLLKVKHFPHLANAKILFLANRRRMINKGNAVLGKIIRPNDLSRYLSRHEAPNDGYDYIILLDGKLLQHCEDTDIERVLRHELRHTFFDAESKAPFKLVDHDFSDFHDEVELNRDDPGWARRLSQTVSLIYHQEKDS